jgi:hypothetical protein
MLERLKWRKLLGLRPPDGVQTTGIRLADVGSSECDVICLDVSKTAACETFVVLSDAKCNDVLLRSGCIPVHETRWCVQQRLSGSERWTKEENHRR